ncbi:MAG: 2-succinyl-5-enolpyruvyl-6-hydroxy-3-cyclohexene-1-carboxylic-acid synthase [Acidimicrobiales bacterium]
MSVPTGDRGVADLQAAYAVTLADEWARNGVVHAVVCPGSRSAPLALALAAEPRITVHVRLDERSAAFTALGVGLATGTPAVMLTTSGTAAAELHAAVVEADLASVPLLVCTADRPPELHGVGAPQTIEQRDLFDGAVRFRCDPGVVDGSSRSWWRSVASRSVIEATRGPKGPGPVHLNLSFREPLVGEPSLGGGAEPGRSSGDPWHVAPEALGAPTDAMLDALASADRELPARGLIVAGARSGEPGVLGALSRAFRWPLLADPVSGARLPDEGVIAMADPLLRTASFVDAHWPEVLLCLGGGWASKPVQAYLGAAAERGARVVVVDPGGSWRDPERRASVLLRCDPSEYCRLLLERSDDASRRPGVRTREGEWWQEWTAAEARLRAALGELLAERLDEPSLAHRVFASLPSGTNLVVASSMPVRDLESFATPRPSPPTVFANRGANGIDGVVSTALGVAIGSGAPTVALVGDLAFLHDVTALVGAELPSLPLTVVVADNRGGGIFSFLEQAALVDGPTFELLFGTPQVQDPGSVAAGFGWPVDRIDQAGGDHLETLLAERIASGSPSVIRVRLPERTRNVERHRALFAVLSGAVEGVTAQQGRGS